MTRRATADELSAAPNGPLPAQPTCARTTGPAPARGHWKLRYAFDAVGPRWPWYLEPIAELP